MFGGIFLKKMLQNTWRHKQLHLSASKQPDLSLGLHGFESKALQSFPQAMDEIYNRPMKF